MNEYKRYDMKTEYNKYCCEEQVVPCESEDGAWVKYSDIAGLCQ